jgi:hypothetical protein
MTYEKLWVGVVLVAGLAGACSASKGGSSGTAGSSGAAGATAGSGGASGSSGTGGAGGALVAPTELASAPGCGNIRLLVSGGTLYWTNKTAGTVNSVPVTGGTPKVIAMAQHVPNPVAVDGTSIYWGNDGDRTVMKQALANGTAAVLIPAPTDADPKNVVNALLIANATLYIGRGLDTYKVPTAGGSLLQLSASPPPPGDAGYPTAFALDGTHLFQTEAGHLAISREVLDGTQDGLLETGVAQALAPDRISVSRSGLVTDAIAISGTHVVWANLTGIESHDKDTTEKESTLSVIANSADYSAITGFVISGDKIYLADSGDNSIQVVGLSFATRDGGDAPTGATIAANQVNAVELAADDTSLYWATIDTATSACKIMKLAK